MEQIVKKRIPNLGVYVGVRLAPEIIRRIDMIRRESQDDIPTRSVIVRELIIAALDRR